MCAMGKRQMTNAPPLGSNNLTPTPAGPIAAIKKVCRSKKRLRVALRVCFGPQRERRLRFFSLAGLYVCRWEVLINKNSSARRTFYCCRALFVFGPPCVSPSRLNCDREAAHLHFYWAIKRAHSFMLVYMVSVSSRVGRLNA
jgi:hypothetical protein